MKEMFKKKISIFIHLFIFGKGKRLMKPVRIRFTGARQIESQIRHGVPITCPECQTYVPL